MRLDKNGQVLILFIIFIPLIIMMWAFVVDIGVISNAHAKLENVSRMIIKDVIDEENKQDKIEKLFKENNIDITNLKVDINNDKIRIRNEIEIESIFGNIIGIDSYKIKVDVMGYKLNNKIMIE